MACTMGGILRNQAIAFSYRDDPEPQLSDAESVELRNCMLESTLSRSITQPASAVGRDRWLSSQTTRRARTLLCACHNAVEAL